MEETITITKDEYKTLRRAELKLIYLENGGVDNWEWYGDSLNEEYDEALKLINAE